MWLGIPNLMRRRSAGRQWTVVGMAFGAVAGAGGTASAFRTVVDLYPGSLAGRRGLQTAIERGERALAVNGSGA